MVAVGGGGVVSARPAVRKEEDGEVTGGGRNRMEWAGKAEGVGGSVVFTVMGCCAYPPGDIFALLSAMFNVQCTYYDGIHKKIERTR